MRQLRAAGVNQPRLAIIEILTGGLPWLEAVPNLSGAYFVTLTESVFGNDTNAPPVVEFMDKFQEEASASGRLPRP